MKDIPEFYRENQEEIFGFFGDNRFLSNFWPATVYLEGMKFPSVENAYQSAKVWPDDRRLFQEISGGQAKKLWKELAPLDGSSDEWNNRKYDVMAGLVFQKFHFRLDLRKKLIETGDRKLIEANNWGDVFWGVDIKKGGQNQLGELLMRVRDFWKPSEFNFENVFHDFIDW